jgi:hypothetical protein
MEVVSYRLMKMKLSAKSNCVELVHIETAETYVDASVVFILVGSV